jgi:hypothetical protein
VAIEISSNHHQLDIHGCYKGIHESNFQANKCHIKNRINMCLEVRFKLKTCLVYGFFYHYARTFHIRKLESSYHKESKICFTCWHKVLVLLKEPIFCGIEF